MKKTIAIFFALIFFSITTPAQKCKYDKNGVENPPYVWSTIEFKPKTVQKIKGKVLDANDEPVAGTIVAVHQLDSNTAKFIGSFETDSKGRFCFGGLKAGKYRITIGKQNFQRIVVEVNLEPKNKKVEKDLSFNLEVGY
jgi:protocatechuate 3,4-dioxygenase beta subunit